MSKNEIETKLAGAIDLDYLEVVNESRFHNVPRTLRHILVILISSQFEGLRLVQRSIGL